MKNGIDKIRLCWCGVSVAILLAMSCSGVLAHDGHIEDAPWRVCDDKPQEAACQYENAKGDVFIGSCQTIQGHRQCIRNQPILKAPVSGAETEKNAPLNN